MKVAITTGDPMGVGPVVSLRAAEDVLRSDLYGRANLKITIFGDKERLHGLCPLALRDDSRLTFFHSASWDAASRAGHRASAAGGQVQLQALSDAVDGLNAEQYDALVTAPMSKSAVAMSGTPFSGHTEYLAERSGLNRDDVTMIFDGPKLSVALVTTHVSIRTLPENITRPRIRRSVEHLRALLRQKNAGDRIVVCGLNPHAGEDGQLGREEIEVIAPTISAFGDSTLVGPIGAESAFRFAQAGRFAGVVAMYHDQATIASKLLDWSEAVNITWGLPFLRTSVDHGVAYDAAASDDVDANGMIAALRAAIDIGGGLG